MIGELREAAGFNSAEPRDALGRWVRAAGKTGPLSAGEKQAFVRHYGVQLSGPEASGPTAQLAMRGRAITKDKFEGPTGPEAVRMAERRARTLLAARHAEGLDDDLSFDLDSAAWDMEAELQKWGLDPNTGKPEKKKRKAAA